MKYSETHFRSLIKSFSWRIMGSIATFLIALFFTRRIDISAEIGVVDFFLKVLAYYVHERLWNYIPWGK